MFKTPAPRKRARMSPVSSANSNSSSISVESYQSGSQTKARKRGLAFGLASALEKHGRNAPANWTYTASSRMKNYSANHLPDAFDILKRTVGIEMTEDNLNRNVLAYLKREKNWQTVFGRRTPTPRKPKTEKKVKFTRSPGPGNTSNNPIIINAIKKLENKIKNQANAMVRARESQTQQALENSRRELAQIRKEIRGQQRNLREVVMRRGSSGGSYRPGGLRATPYYTRYMQRVYQRADGQFVTISPNGRPGRPMMYPNFAYRDTGRGIVMHAPIRRPRRKTLFRL
jgi:hypothetical protein